MGTIDDVKILLPMAFYAIVWISLGIYCYKKAAKTPGILLIIAQILSLGVSIFNILGIYDPASSSMPVRNATYFFFISNILNVFATIMFMLAFFLLIKEVIKNKKQSNTTAIDSIGKSNEKL